MGATEHNDNEAFGLNDEEITESLRTNDEKLIDTVYETCLNLFYKEEDRSKAIDAKGSTLLGMSGLSTGVVFSLGGILIEKITNIALPIIGCPIPWMVLFYFTSSLTLLSSIFFALLSIRARSDWRWLKDTDIFRSDMIESGVGPYKRYVITHAWKVYRNNFYVNEKKANFLKIGNVLFAAALFQLLPIVGIIALYSLKR
jgi:hypothetical protein